MTTDRPSVPDLDDAAAGYLCSVTGLEEVVGARPPSAFLKSIDHLDAHCETFLAVSTFAVTAVVAPSGQLTMTATGGPPGHLRPDSTRALALSGSHRFDPDATDGAPVGILSFAPGYRETLRVNGRLRCRGDAVAVDVEEAFLHCAKAVIRSRLWDPPAESSDLSDPVVALPSDSIGDAGRAFLARAPIVALGSVDAHDDADVSPKGDPVGFVAVLDDRTVVIPDRPGNHRTDTMHNLIEHPEIGLLALVPGDPRVLELRGRARVSGDPAIRGPLAVGGRVPKAALVIDVAHVDLRVEPALAAARLWDASLHIDPKSLPTSSRIWTDHVRLNNDPGPDAEAMRQMVDEEALSAGLTLDYEHNLY